MPLQDLPPLTDPAVLGDRDELRARAAAEPEVLPADRYDGAEESQSIWVSVDPRCRVLSVDISSTWRKRLEPDGFAGALFAAYSAAVRQASAVGAPRRAPAEPVAAGPEPVAPDPDTEVWLSKVRAWSAAMDERLAQLASARVAPPDVREVRGPAGYVTLRLRGSVVVGITANAAALKSANPNTLRQDVLDAFDATEY